MIGRLTVVCLLALALPLLHHRVEAGPSTQEKKSQRDTCHDPIKETPGNNPYSSSYPCPLLNQLRYYATCGCTSQVTTYGLTVSDQTALLAWISDMEVTLQGMGEINDTSVVDVCVSLKAFLDVHISIRNAISYLSLNDSSGAFWGTVEDFLNVRIEIQFEIIPPILVIGGDGECELTKAITAAAQASGDAKIISECHNVTLHIKSLLKLVEFNVTEQLSFIFQIIQQECSAETIAFLVSSCHIEGFGAFSTCLDVCKINFQIQQMNIYLSGSSDTDCDLLEDLKKCKEATCIVGAANFSQCVTIVNMIDQITVDIQASVSIEVRLETCANHIFQFCKLAPWICNMDLEIGGCKLSDFVYISGFCHMEDCCDCNDHPPELPDCSCEDSGSGSGSGSGSASGETATPPASSSGSGSASGETKAPCDDSSSGSCDEGETGAPGECDSSSGSCETAPPASSGSGSGSASQETTPASSSGSGSASQETTPASSECDGTGPCSESSEETTPASAEETTVAPTTAAPTTVAPTTAAPTTVAPTTPKPTTVQPTVSHCEARAELIVVTVSCNCSAFLVSITSVTNGWGFTQKQSIKPVIDKMFTIIYNSTATLAQKMAALWNLTTTYEPTNSAYKTQWLAISLYKSDGVTLWGSLADFGNCGSSCTCSG